MICEFCGKDIEENRASCPECGTECSCGGQCGSHSYNDNNNLTDTGVKKERRD